MKIGINGLGRIGRLCLRAAIERQDASLVAINTSAKAQDLAHLIKYDSTHGRAPFDIVAGEDFLQIGEQKIQILSHKSAATIPWKDFGVDVLLECSGKLTTKELALEHKNVDKIIVSSPCAMADSTIIMGVNEQALTGQMGVISIGSCTTNALAPIVKILNDNFAIQAGYATTVHSYTFDQNLLDNFHDDPRRSRGASTSMIPTKSGITSALKLVLPEVAQHIKGSAIRVPTPNVSLVDFSFQSKNKMSAESINQAVQEAADSSMRQILCVTQGHHVSIDFNHTAFSSIFDPFETQVVGPNFARVLCWYDNEWGFANRMIDASKLFFKVKP